MRDKEQMDLVEGVVEVVAEVQKGVTVVMES
jgi:hypothetical protein